MRRSPTRGCPARSGSLRAALAALARRDAAGLARAYPTITFRGASGSASRPLDAGATLDLLAGCTRGAARRLRADTYTVDFACPTRRASARGCAWGDLAFIAAIRDRAPSLLVTEDRKVTPDCPVLVPPPPPGFADPRDHARVTGAMLAAIGRGDDAAAGAAILPDREGNRVALFGGPGGERRWPLSPGSLRTLLAGCTRAGKIEVDGTGATFPYACAGPALRGPLLVNFDFIGRLIARVRIGRDRSPPLPSGPTPPPLPR